MKFPPPDSFRINFDNPLWHDFARIVARRHRIPVAPLERATAGESIVFLTGEKFVLKIFIPNKNGLARERLALETARTSLPIPRIVAHGSFEGYDYLFTTRIEGSPMMRENWLGLPENEQKAILSELAAGLRELHSSDASRIEFDWSEFVERQAATCYERQRKCQVNERALAEIPGYLDANLSLLPADGDRVFLHGDVHFGNLRLKFENGKWRISGLFDFADSLKGFREYDFLAVGLLMIQGQGDLQRHFFREFGYRDDEIDEALRKRLMLLTMFYEWSDLRRYAVRLRPEAVEYSLIELERAIWNFC
ncbi:MAG: aminoglycoside phosphotransferase family protein [Acidobacteria bacterium]|nr:aminoglycoside phosphotransferase family protein [Acidobacteriota bacterium]